MKSNDTNLSAVMKEIKTGAIQLPEFQRPWVWDDEHIKKLIFSIIHNYPIGAVMFLECDNDNVIFKAHELEGVELPNYTSPAKLILDGQQRLTSIFNAIYSPNPVSFGPQTDDELQRFYYLDIEKALDPSADVDEVVISVPKTKIIKTNFGRDIALDLSSQEKEFIERKFPLNVISDPDKYEDWLFDYRTYHKDPPYLKQFRKDILKAIQLYTIPVITLEKDTPKEAVCQIFESVNTGGVSLTVFELMTAIFAMGNFSLRDDWEKRKKEIFASDLLKGVTETDFLTALTLLSSYKKSLTNSTPVSCKKRDVLKLTLEEYQCNADILCSGFKKAETLLQNECIYTARDLPYSTQLIPLSAICAVLLEDKKYADTAINKIKQWFWCGVFGELYGSANETRFALDIVQVTQWAKGGGELPKTCLDAHFTPSRLLTMQTRQSAAYKGLMALILKNQCKDLITGELMSFDVYKAENVDIHHIFPKAYCTSLGLPEKKWNSIVNKTPLTYRTNREIGGDAPSIYLTRIERKSQVDHAKLDTFLRTHFILPTHCREDKFDLYFLNRAGMLLDAIENATGRTIAGRDSEEVIREFGAKL